MAISMTAEKILSARIKSLMRDSGVLDTQFRLAKASGVAQSSINRILAVEQSPTLAMMTKIASAFRIKRPEFLLMNDTEIRMLNALSELSPAEQLRHTIAVENSVAFKKTNNPVKPDTDFEAIEAVVESAGDLLELNPEPGWPMQDLPLIEMKNQLLEDLSNLSPSEQRRVALTIKTTINAKKANKLLHTDGDGPHSFDRSDQGHGNTNDEHNRPGAATGKKRKIKSVS